MKASNTIEISEVRRLFNLDAEAGQLSRRIAPPRRPDLLGKVVGSRCLDGHLKARVGSKFYYVHRLIWAHHYGTWPDEIDHKDRDKSNNRLNNLRECSHSQNCHNRRKTTRNSSGVKGIFVTKNGRYRATMRHNKKQIYIGQFKTLSEATAARRLVADKLAGEFAA